MLITLEDARRACASGSCRCTQRFTRVRAGQARAVRRQPAAGRLDRQEVPQPRPVVPRPDPGRQHRPDAGGRQVRVPPRLQVQHLRDVVDPPGDHPGHRRPGPDDPHPGPHDRDDVASCATSPRSCSRRWAASRPSRRRPRPPNIIGRGDAAGAEDQPAPDQPRPAGRRERGQLLRRLHRGRGGREPGRTPRRRRCSRTRSSRCSRR